MTKRGQALSVLMVSSFAFTVCFMVWMMGGAFSVGTPYVARWFPKQQQS